VYVLYEGTNAKISWSVLTAHEAEVIESDKSYRILMIVDIVSSKQTQKENKLIQQKFRPKIWIYIIWVNKHKTIHVPMKIFFELEGELCAIR
jgi:hypothetical protein